jgi:hypothetical protein
VKKRFSLLPRMAAAMALSVMLSACGAINATPINEINNSPANFDGKEVTLYGVVKDPTRLPLLNTKSYMLKDGSGEILILTQADLPKMNEEVSVKVKVENIAIINGESLGMTVTEISRR